MKKSNEKIQEMVSFCHRELLKASSRASRAKNLEKKFLLEDYAKYWRNARISLEHLDSEKFKKVR